MAAHALIVDDEPSLPEQMAEILRYEGYGLVTNTEGQVYSLL
jgi:DNA-binding response OmpR family regulator